MPPKAKLSETQVADLSEWVKQGAFWPEGAESAPATLSAMDRAAQDRRTHWAYQPIARPALPQIPNPKSPIENGLDALVLEKILAAGLRPAPEADRRTLARRLAFDLLGLPPTPEEVELFVADEAPDAYERLADRFLSSPQFGERWARHWLDVARYGDTRGYAFQRERRYPYAYTYRDYVIRAFNEDLPYDRFIQEQLAADQLELGEDKRPLAAMGFLTTGRKFNDFHNDMDDLIDVVTRGLVGLTVACARCHDHKFDAIPADDYYSLFGVFQSSRQPDDLPIIAPKSEAAKYEAFQAELQKKKDAVTKYDADRYAEIQDTVRKRTADYLARIAGGDDSGLLARAGIATGEDEVRPKILQRWKDWLKSQVKADHAVWGLWLELTALSTDDFATKAAGVVAKWNEKPVGVEAGQLNPLLKAALAELPPADKLGIGKAFGKAFGDAYEAWKQAGANAEAENKLSPEQRQLAQLLLGKGAPSDFAAADVAQYFTRAERDQRSKIQKEVDSFQANAKDAPPRAMVMLDNDKPGDARLLIRGQPGRPGKVVPRQFLLVVAGPERQPFAKGSGRLELANAIVSPNNPLTARVLVNRFWMHHFGEPMVNTPSDFGIRTERPALAEALDWLAAELQGGIRDSELGTREQAWSLKRLHRIMVSSATYRRSSAPPAPSPEFRAPSQADPENRLLSYANRRRLEFEPLRDTLLALAGRLDTRLEGRPEELTKTPFSRRRAVYGYLDRQDLPNLFRVFDLASPDQSAARRPRTTVPQQALFLMNSPFVVEQARGLVGRDEIQHEPDTDKRITALYRCIFQRRPADEELDIARHFVQEAQSAPAEEQGKLGPWEQLAQLLLLTNEVAYID
jgi:hypothetical protein